MNSHSPCKTSNYSKNIIHIAEIAVQCDNDDLVGPFEILSFRSVYDDFIPWWYDRGQEQDFFEFESLIIFPLIFCVMSKPKIRGPPPAHWRS
jgi:hypothetical protein